MVKAFAAAPTVDGERLREYRARDIAYNRYADRRIALRVLITRACTVEFRRCRDKSVGRVYAGPSIYDFGAEICQGTKKTTRKILKLKKVTFFLKTGNEKNKLPRFDAILCFIFSLTSREATEVEWGEMDQRSFLQMRRFVRVTLLIEKKNASSSAIFRSVLPSSCRRYEHFSRSCKDGTTNHASA